MSGGFSGVLVKVGATPWIILGKLYNIRKQLEHRAEVGGVMSGSVKMAKVGGWSNIKNVNIELELRASGLRS